MVGVTAGSQTTGPSSRSGSMAHLHTGTGFNFPKKEGGFQAPASGGVLTADAEQETSRSTWAAGSGGQAQLFTAEPWQSPATNSRQQAGSPRPLAHTHLETAAPAVRLKSK